ncbi:MAG: DUF2383 domain-containing protein [Rhodobacteraceae bacterium]|nr:MAG: DUF2383 domain-containing protein [Paracoccaceae bacterium]
MTDQTTGRIPSQDAQALSGGPGGPGDKRGPEQPPLELLAEVHTRLVDTISGFEKVTEKAEPEFRPVAEEFLEMHRRHEAELAAHLASLGHEPQADGSIFGTVNRAVVALRSWFEDVSENIMDRITQGERHLIEAYDAARESRQSIETNAILMRHSAEIDAMMEKHQP